MTLAHMYCVGIKRMNRSINIEIREFEDKVFDLFNMYQLEPEIKRLVAQSVLNKVTKLADDQIRKEVDDEIKIAEKGQTIKNNQTNKGGKVQ